MLQPITKLEILSKLELHFYHDSHFLPSKSKITCVLWFTWASFQSKHSFIKDKYTRFSAVSLLLTVPRGEGTRLHIVLRPSSHRTQSTSQQAYANYGTHCSKWECWHSLQATSKGLHTNLHQMCLHVLCERALSQPPDKQIHFTNRSQNGFGCISG